MAGFVDPALFVQTSVGVSAINRRKARLGADAKRVREDAWEVASAAARQQVDAWDGESDLLLLTADAADAIEAGTPLRMYHDDDVPDIVLPRWYGIAAGQGPERGQVKGAYHSDGTRFLVNVYVDGRRTVRLCARQQAEKYIQLLKEREIEQCAVAMLGSLHETVAAAAEAGKQTAFLGHKNSTRRTKTMRALTQRLPEQWKEGYDFFEGSAGGVDGIHCTPKLAFWTGRKRGKRPGDDDEAASGLGEPPTKRVKVAPSNGGV